MFNSYHGRLRGVLALALMLVLGAGHAFAQWSTLPGPAETLQLPQSASLNGKLYVFGGYGIPPGGSTAQALKLAQVFDPATGAWKAIKSLPEARYGGYAAAINGKIYIVGGQLAQSKISDFYTSVQEYDPIADTYTAKADAPAVATQGAGAVVGNKIILIGGLSIASNSLVYGGAMSYDASVDTWSVFVNSTPYYAYGGTATAIGNTIYYVGGQGNSGVMSSVNKGTISGSTTITWKATTDYPMPITGASSGVFNGKLYVAGGVSSDPTGVVYMYDDVTAKWKWHYSLPQATYDAGSMMTEGPAMYFAGGVLNPNMYKLTADKTVATAVPATTEIKLAVQKGTQRTFALGVFNSGVADLTGSLTIPGSAPWMMAAPPSITVAPGTTQNLNLTFDASTLNVGTYTANATLMTNDPDHAAMPITAKIYVVDKLVLQNTRAVIEEGTGDWCGYCPYGHDSLAAMQEDMGDQIVILSYHGGSASEPMQVSAGTQIVEKLGINLADGNHGWPNASINRHIWPGDPNPMINRGLWRGRTEQFLAMQPVSPVTLTVDNYNFDPATKKVTATVNILVTAPIAMTPSMTMNLTAAVTQDSILFPQTFYPPTGGTTTLTDYYNSEVVRVVWPNATGQALTIPASAIQDGDLMPGTTLTQNVSFTANVSSSDSRLAFKPEMSHFVVFAHLNDAGNYGEALQGYVAPLAKTVAPVMQVATVKNAISVKPQDTAVFTTTVKNLTDAPLDLTLTRDWTAPSGEWLNWMTIGTEVKTFEENTAQKTLAPGETVTITIRTIGGFLVGSKGIAGITYTASGQTKDETYTTTVISGGSGVAEAAVTGTTLTLDQNVPNPATGLTRFDYFLPTAGASNLDVYTVAGTKVMSIANGRQEKGIHSVNVDASTLPNGVYTVVLNVNGSRVTRTMTVVR
jgi:N-acetylneuraminic acid mutarotase